MTPDRTQLPSGTLWLDAPDWRDIDTVVQRPAPWPLWRVGFQSVLAHWMDEAVRRNVAEVAIIASDRATEIEASLGGGVYWSRLIRMHDRPPADAPTTRESLGGLPGLPMVSVPTDGAGLLRHWLQLQLGWLKARHETISLDRQLHPRVWVGPRVSIHPQARLTGPCWIGSHSQIGADAEIGPNAIIGTHSVIDAHASVRDSVVMPDTFVGSRIHLSNMIADGTTLLDATRGTRVEIGDRFMLARLHASLWARLFGSPSRS